jgi:cell division transport system permease protein
MALPFDLKALLRLGPASRPAADPDDDDAPTGPTPLVPADSIAGRSLVIVIAIMTFLAALAAAAMIFVSQSSAEWRAEATSEATVQIRPAKARDTEADIKKVVEILKATPGVRDTQVYSKAESEALVAPWLGAGLDLSQLPMPRMIVVKLDPAQRPDVDDIKSALARAAPNATFDDHRLFMRRVGDMARAAAAAAGLIFTLILAALGVVVASATRAAVATNREIVDVLHIVGAADAFIAREFQRRFLSLGLRGALVGAGAATAFLLAARALLVQWRTTAGGEQMEAMFGDLSIGLTGFAAILALAGVIGLLTGELSRRIVLAHLRGFARAPQA